MLVNIIANDLFIYIIKLEVDRVKLITIQVYLDSSLILFRGPKADDCGKLTSWLALFRGQKRSALGDPLHLVVKSSIKKHSDTITLITVIIMVV